MNVGIRYNLLYLINMFPLTLPAVRHTKTLTIFMSFNRNGHPREKEHHLNGLSIDSTISLRYQLSLDDDHCEFDVTISWNRMSVHFYLDRKCILHTHRCLQSCKRALRDFATRLWMQRQMAAVLIDYSESIQFSMDIILLSGCYERQFWL